MRVFLLIGLGCALLLSLLGALTNAAPADEATSRAAFATMLKVLNHPRCMNCHTTANWPTQGDDQHRHNLNVVRGPDDRGPPGMRCTTCHAAANSAMAPGAKDWHMAPRSQGWTGLTPGALCRALLDPAKNGGRSGEKVIEHMRADALVLWAWTPGGKRTTPPVTHKDFVTAAEKWLKTGAHCPAT